MLATQLSRNSRAKSLSSLSSAVMSIVDLTDDLSSSDLIPQLLSDNVRDDEQPEGEVEFIGNTVANQQWICWGCRYQRAGCSSGIEPVIKVKNSGIPWNIFLIYSFETDVIKRKRFSHL